MVVRYCGIINERTLVIEQLWCRRLEDSDLNWKTRWVRLRNRLWTGSRCWSKVNSGHETGQGESVVDVVDVVDVVEERVGEIVESKECMII